MSKIIVAISGGVDSAVTTKILKDQGHEVIGVFMRNWDAAINNDNLGNPNKNALVCPEEKDWDDAKKIARQIGVKIDRVDFIHEYWDEIFAKLIRDYKAGRTPNPDIWCNRYIKFGHFFEYVFNKYANVDFVATGHYADVENGILKKPRDLNKDQTYFLAQVKKEMLYKITFPLAKIEKKDVRKLAQKHSLVVANKRDSTGICFIGKRNFTKFLQNYIPTQPGKIIDISTKKQVGTHTGAMYYTIGQRRGLHLGGMREPYYVVGHNLKNKIVFVAPQSDESYLQSNEALIKNINWLVARKSGLTNLHVKFRYRSKAVACSIKWIRVDTLKVLYPDGFKAVTPGQQAVFYSGNFCIGGGVIDKVYRDGVLKKYI